MSLAGPSNLAAELLWREVVWAELQAHPLWPDLPPDLLREKKLYAGQAGIYADMTRTREISPTGIAVSVLHTGQHYADDVDDDGIIYHYPTTGRRSHDQNEIDSVKTAQRLKVPVFVIVQKGTVRNVKRAWVTDSDDVSRLFLFTFSAKNQEDYIVEPDRNPLFVAQVDRPRTKAQIMRRERSSKFKFEVLKKYENKCVLSNLSVVEMLDGAHVIPVERGGSDDVRNGLLLSASIHRAFDAKLWAINPDTLRIETRERGPSLEKMKITVDSLAGSTFLPHIDALAHRYKIFKEAG